MFFHLFWCKICISIFNCFKIFSCCSNNLSKIESKNHDSLEVFQPKTVLIAVYHHILNFPFQSKQQFVHNIFINSLEFFPHLKHFFIHAIFKVSFLSIKKQYLLCKKDIVLKIKKPLA